ncbi:fumarylacetoacetate hydrolase family protein [Amycolatopsis pithecellobii]|uniref:Fumarylacetoacetate hydrolase family protein n=1 Tax=Amycolatopsis pithecellobii TaxID=664692 RepID=A0A6N7YVV4_9PSEU|nr:fumarylacetoacetate hydrolase family protein [Amycolatopsis pithecellobii]MTD53003.1 fumarylacetoacetate hydrolase family protein [Amycolatopsis pithecellobii]
MKLVTFAVRRAEGHLVRAGVLLGDVIVDVDLALAGQGREPVASGRSGGDSSLLRLISGGERVIEATREATARAVEKGTDRLGDARILYPAGDVQLVSPLPRPNSLRDYLVIEEHLRGVIAAGVIKDVPDEWYRIPAHYKGNIDEIYGPDDTVPWPAYTGKLDYELEVCAVIGTPGRRIRVGDAGRHIVGYTLYNDWSARDIQAREMSIGNGPGISKDFGSSLGPCIATPDEFDLRTAHLEARIDGEVWSAGTLGTMQFSFEELIEWTSQEQTLRPGDLLGSGTIGKGCGVELGRWLTEGCQVELEAEGIGILRNRVGYRGQGPRRAVDIVSRSEECTATTSS